MRRATESPNHRRGVECVSFLMSKRARYLDGPLCRGHRLKVGKCRESWQTGNLEVRTVYPVWNCECLSMRQETGVGLVFKPQATKQWLWAVALFSGCKC